MTGTVKALVGCQNDYCSEEMSYYLDMVRMFEGQPLCQTCYEEGGYGERDEDGWPRKDWTDLQPVELKDLRA